jgi:DNA-binding CsgD family transcriptional regulator
MPAISGNFVRSTEWRRIREFAAGAKGRAAPAALVVAGEAGAGKSTLWRAAVNAAADSGAWVLRSEPSAIEADAPFAGLADLLAADLPGVAADIPAECLEALEVALLLRPAGAAAPAAHAIGQAVLAALDSLIRREPVLVAVDDAQWLDAGSLEALGFALRQLTKGPLSLLIAARTEAAADPRTVGTPAPSRDWQGLLTAVTDSAEVVLAPLDTAQVQRLLPAATVAQAQLVANQSRGNPFWALELWPDIAAAPPAASEDTATPTPRLVAGRFRRSLPPPAFAALAVVAAAERIDVGDAVTVMRLEGIADPEAALEAAIQAGAVIKSGGRLIPAHPLIGVAAVEEVPPVRRAALYRRVAETSVSLERRAQFTARAAAAIGAMPDPEVADVLEQAAEAASGRAATAIAGKFARQAVEFTPESDAAALVRRRIRAGELLFLASDLKGARDQLEALDLDSLATADVERVLPLLADAVDYVGGHTAVTAMITRALKTASNDDRRRALVCSLASDISYGIPGRRRESAVEAIRCAEAAGRIADRSLHRALVNLMIEKLIAGEGVDAGLLGRAEDVERRVPGVQLHDTADRHRGTRYLDVEDLDAARSALLRCIARARKSGENLVLAIFLSYLARTEQLAGDYQQTAALLAEVSTVEATYDLPPCPSTLVPRYEVLLWAGETAEALRLADDHFPDDEGRHLGTRFKGACLRGKAHWWAGDIPAAVRHLELAARYADELGWRDPGIRLQIDHLLAEACLATGQTAEAARISAWLREFGTRMNRPAQTGYADRIDALAAAAGGDLDAAAACARAAVAAHAQTPLRLELVRSLLVLGRIERRRRDRPAARAALQQSWDLARTIGHRPLLTQVEDELARTTTVRPRQQSSALTDAEQRVAEQIATGATSREVAAKLFISPRTVETHISSIYRKLGVQSRLELRRHLAELQPLSGVFRHRHRLRSFPGCRRTGPPPTLRTSGQDINLSLEAGTYPPCRFRRSCPP